MFLWSADNILNQIEKYSKGTYEALKDIETVDNEEIQELINDNYHKTEAISIDYAVMEKSDSIYVIPSRFGWDDVGSWEALDRYREKDDKGNVLVGNAKVVDSHGNLVISSSHDIVVEGLKDIYVIENDGKILVGHKSNVANVKELKILYRWWGKYEEKLLIYAHYFYPDVASTGQILTELTEGMRDTFDITVICVVPSYSGTVEEKYKTKRMYMEEYKGMKVIRVRVPEFQKVTK